MAALVLLLLAVLSCKAHAQFLPLQQQQQIITPLQQQQQIITPCEPSSPVTSQVVTTVVDNSVANALANAIQLLIVSNLIENTMGNPVANALTAAVPNIVDAIPVQATVYNPIDYFNPYSPYEPINNYPIAPCDVIEPVIEVFPAVCPDVIGPVGPIGSNGCGCGAEVPANFGYPNIGVGLPNVGYGGAVEVLPNLYRPNPGYSYETPIVASPYVPINAGYPCDGPIVANPYGPISPCEGPIVTNPYGPISPCEGPIGTNPYGPISPCNGPAEVIYPGVPPQAGFNYGGPNFGFPNIPGAGPLGALGPNLNPMSLLASKLLGGGGFF